MTRIQPESPALEAQILTNGLARFSEAHSYVFIFVLPLVCLCCFINHLKAKLLKPQFSVIGRSPFRSIKNITSLLSLLLFRLTHSIWDSSTPASPKQRQREPRPGTHARKHLVGCRQEWWKPQTDGQPSFWGEAVLRHGLVTPHGLQTSHRKFPGFLRISLGSWCQSLLLGSQFLWQCFSILI